MLELKDLFIGMQFTLKSKEIGEFKRPVRTLEIIGLFYEGVDGNSKWKDMSDLMNSQTLFIQYVIESVYTFSGPQKGTQDAQEFIDEFNEELKLLPEFRTYTLISKIYKNVARRRPVNS